MIEGSVIEDERTVEHLLVQFDVALGASLVVEPVQGFRHDARDLRVAEVARHPPEIHRAIHRPEEPVRVVGIEDEPVAGVLGGVEHLHGIVQSARVVGDGERTLDRRLHLGKPARLEERRHDHEVRTGEAELREASVEVVYAEPSLNAVEGTDVPERLLVGAVRDDRELCAVVPVFAQEPVGDVGEELRPLLDRIETRRPEEDGRIRILLKPERMLKR